MKVNSSTEFINVQDQLKRKDSPLAFWRRVLLLRKQYNELFVHGNFELLDRSNPNVFSFVKRRGSRLAVVVCNCSGNENKVPYFDGLDSSRIVLGNVEKPAETTLQPWEGRAYVLSY